MSAHRHLKFFGLLGAAAAALTACKAPGEEATGVGAACVESDLVAQCPPGSNPVLGATAQSMCQVDGEVDLVENSGAVSGRCYGAGTCHVACRFASPCPCGVDSVTRDGVFCTDCANAAACGNGTCEGGETFMSCPNDCAADCTPGMERCQETDRETCDGTGHWMRLACLSGETCEPTPAGPTRCVRNDVQRGGETGEPEPREDRVDGRIWFGDGALPAEGTGSHTVGAPAPNAGYALEALAFVGYDPNTGVPSKDLSRAGYGRAQNGELMLDWRARLFPADVDEGPALLYFGPKRAARYSLALGPPPDGQPDVAATYPPDMAGDEGDVQRGLSAMAGFSADLRTVLWARHFYDFSGGGAPVYLRDAELMLFELPASTNTSIARTGIYTLTPAPPALSPDGRFSALGVTLPTSASAVMLFDGATPRRPLSTSRIGEGGYAPHHLSLSPNGALLATEGGGTYLPPELAQDCGQGVDLWNVADGKRIYTICQTAGIGQWLLEDLSFDPTGQRLAITIAGSAFGIPNAHPPGVEIWDVTTGREIATISTANPPRAKFTPDGGALVTLAMKHGGQQSATTTDLALWDKTTGARLEQVLRWDTSAPDTLPSTEDFPDPELPGAGAAFAATDFRFSPRGTRLVVVGDATCENFQACAFVATFRAGGL